MQNFFSFDSYRDLMLRQINERKAQVPSFTAQGLCAEIGVQKSYFSKVLGKNAHLNGDQLYLVAKYFEWDEKQTEFVRLLHEYERSGLATRQKELRQQIAKIQCEHLKISKIIQRVKVEKEEILADYYSDPVMALVHTGLFIKKYSQAPELLADILNISTERLHGCIERLVQLGLVKVVKGRPQGQVATLHLANDSPQFRTWMTKVRLLAANHILLNSKDHNYHFGVYYSADASAKQLLQKEFISFLERAKSIVDQAPSDKIYYMGFDLFSWDD